MLAWLCVVLNEFSPLLHVGFLWEQCFWKCWLELQDLHSGKLNFYVVILLNTFPLKMFLSTFQLCNTKAMAWLPFLNNSVLWICIKKSKCVQETTAADWVWTVLKNSRMQHVVQVGLKWKKKKDGIWIYIGILLVKENKNLLVTEKDNNKVCFWIQWPWLERCGKWAKLPGRLLGHLLGRGLNWNDWKIVCPLSNFPHRSSCPAETAAK